MFYGMLSGQNLNRSTTSNRDSVYHPTKVSQAVYFDITPPLREMPMVKPPKGRGEKEVENNVNPKYKIYGHHPFLYPEDPVWQKNDGTYLPQNSGPIQNFDGITNIYGYYPPDTQGDVSTDKYVQVTNISWAVYSKTGSLLLGPSTLSTIWSGIPAPWNNTNSGDPVVLWDQAAQRWIISQFSLPSGNYAELVAISQTSDPTGSWYRYVFQFGIQMPDYPKFGIWPDGYYLSVNQFTYGGSWGGVGVAALDRSKMLTGDPTATMQYIKLGTSITDPWSMLPSDWDGTNTPLTGEPNYFTYYDDMTSSSEQYLRIWSFHVDWTTPANTTFSETSSLTTQAFNATLCSAYRGRCIPQPSGAPQLEALSDRLMYRLQYRNFGSYQAMVTNHTVNVDGSGHAGIRWYELRKSGDVWSIYQQGTYAPDASHRWVGSIAMNAHEDIALGYSVSDATSIYPSIRYTGRRATDPLGQMTLAEQTIINGSGVQTGSAARWGDYSMMSVDPADDLTFWFTTEYVQTTGAVSWKTRIASFKFDNSPSVTTTAASSVTTTTATLNGSINPNGLSSTYNFQWGSTVSYGNTTTITSAGSGVSSVSVNAGISGLSPGTTYHYRLLGINSDGTTNGNDVLFTTAVVPSLSVSPPNQNVPATPAGSTAFSVTSNVSWSAGSNQGWCTVTPSGSGNGTITANYTLNTTLVSRMATISVAASGVSTITVTVTQAAGLPYLSVTPPNQNVPSTPSGSTTFNVSSNISWNASSDQSWCTVTPSGSGNGTITANYGVNPAVVSRVAIISIAAPGVSTITVTVTQSAGQGTLSVTPPNQDIPATPVGSTSFTVTSNTSWTVTSDQTWCTVPASGIGSGVLTAAYQVNPTISSRVAHITITASGLAPVIVTVTQEAGLPTLSVLPANQDIPATPAGSTSFTVTSNTSWTVSIDQPWCTVTPSGSGDGTITANYSVNPTVFSRVAIISIAAPGVSTITVTVTQSAGQGTLSVTPPNQDIPATPAGSTSFTVTSNTSWTVTSDQTWCTVPASGSGSGTLTAEYQLNLTVIRRVAHITVTVSGLSPVMVTVTQAAGLPVLSVTPANQNVPASPAGFTAFLLTSNSSWTVTSNQAWLGVTPSGSGDGIVTATYQENPTTSIRDANISVTVPGLSPVIVTVTQESRYIISGNLTYNSEPNPQIPLTGYTVKLKTVPGNIVVATAITNTGGYFEIPAPNGTYQLEALAPVTQCYADLIDAMALFNYTLGIPIPFTRPLRVLAGDVAAPFNGYPDLTDVLAIFNWTVSGIKPPEFTAPPWVFESPTVVVNSAPQTVNISGLNAGNVLGSNPAP